MGSSSSIKTNQKQNMQIYLDKARIIWPVKNYHNLFICELIKIVTKKNNICNMMFYHIIYPVYGWVCLKNCKTNNILLPLHIHLLFFLCPLIHKATVNEKEKIQ